MLQYSVKSRVKAIRAQAEVATEHVRHQGSRIKDQGRQIDLSGGASLDDVL